MCVYRLHVLPWDFLVAVICCVKGLLHFLCWQQMEEIWREMRWIMDVLQHARYKQPSCGISLSGFLSEARGTAKEKTQSSSSHADYLPSPALSPETSRKLNSGEDAAVLSSCLVGSWVAVLGGSGGWSRVRAGQSASAGAGPALPVPWRAPLCCVTRGQNSEASLDSTSAGVVHTQAELLVASLTPRRLSRPVGRGRLLRGVPGHRQRLRLQPGAEPEGARPGVLHLGA